MSSDFEMKPIGYLKSVFHHKNGTPRQSSLVESARGILTIEKSIFTNPDHSLDGLQEYSHAWLLFVFHKNNNPHFKAKVKPPRLNGRRVGVFASRSPYRPNNIGLSLVKIEKIEGSSVHVSGIDIVHGTPVLDIKPYIPDYDAPKFCSSIDPDSQHMNETKLLPEHFSASLYPECQKDSQLPNVMKSESECKIGFDNADRTSIDYISDKAVYCTKTEPRFDDHQALEISKGFYKMSAALKKAEQKLCEPGLFNKECDTAKLNDVSADTSDLMEYSPQIEKTCLSSLKSLNETDKSSCKNITDSFISNRNVKDDSSLKSIDKTVPSSSASNPYNAEKNYKACREDNFGKATTNEINSAVIAPWLLTPPTPPLMVSFTTEAIQQLDKFSSDSSDPLFCLHMLTDTDEARQSIMDILREDPRSVYRKSHCADTLYYFAVDVLHVTSWFDTNSSVQVIRIQPIAYAPKLKNKQ